MFNEKRTVKQIINENKENTTMKKTYKIDVDCANCANKMEDAAKNTAGVKDATVNFMTLKSLKRDRMQRRLCRRFLRTVKR